LKIYYYTICWGDYYLNLLFNISLKSFFSDKFKAKDNIHKVFIYSDSLFKIKRQFNKNLKRLKNKNVDIEIVNFKNEINLFKKKQDKSIWRFLGNFQKKALKHAKKNSAIASFIYPDEVHSENLSNLIINKLNNYDYIFTPSNEIYFTDFKKSKLKILSEKNLLKIKTSNLEKYNGKDFFNYNYYTHHQTRTYFKVGKSIFYKSAHLSPIIMKPQKINNINQIYTLDTTLNSSKKSYIVNPNEALLLSLEKKIDFTKNYKHTNNYLKLFFLRLFYFLNFNIKNISGINPFLYLKTYKIQKNENFQIVLKKIIFFDLFFILIFLFSSIIKIAYNLKKKLFT
tara:strand:+ start:951 stop:1970 length:1020 start_codon:yes stop_codon:yes gene_type:complete